MTETGQTTAAGPDQDKDKFAIASVLWAADRTLLAWIRTSLNMIGFGFVIHQAAQLLHQEGLLAFNSQIFGLGLWVFGVIILIIASWEYRSLRQQLLRNKPLDATRLPFALMVATVMCVIGAMGLISFLTF